MVEARNPMAAGRKIGREEAHEEFLNNYKLRFRALIVEAIDQNQESLKEKLAELALHAFKVGFGRVERRGTAIGGAIDPEPTDFFFSPLERRTVADRRTIPRTDPDRRASLRFEDSIPKAIPTLSQEALFKQIMHLKEGGTLTADEIVDRHLEPMLLRLFDAGSRHTRRDHGQTGLEHKPTPGKSI